MKMDVVDFLVKQVEHKIKEINKDLKKHKNELFSIPTLINSDYFSYLHNYSNGILQFSKPAMLDDEVNTKSL